MLVFRVFRSRHSDGSSAWCLTVVLSEDSGAHAHVELGGGSAEGTSSLNPCAAQESEGTWHQTALSGADDLLLSHMIISPNKLCLEKNLV